MKGSNKQIPSISVDASDFFGSPQIQGTPERNLLMATLERAILDFVGNTETEIIAAEEWIFADINENNHDEFSFAWVCEQLDLEPKKIAAIIKDMPKRGNRRVAPWYFKNHTSDSQQLCA